MDGSDSSTENAITSTTVHPHVARFDQQSYDDEDSFIAGQPFNDVCSSSDCCTSSSDASGRTEECGEEGSQRPQRNHELHRIIEKRRRDRMNNSLASLSRLIPEGYLKKNRGRIEKTEIIEMAIHYIKHIRRQQRSVQSKKLQNHEKQDDRNYRSYQQGFYDCVAETLRLLVAADGMTVNDQFKTRLMENLCDYFTHIVENTIDGSKLVEAAMANYLQNVNDPRQYERACESLSEEPLDMRVGNNNDLQGKCIDYGKVAMVEGGISDQVAVERQNGVNFEQGLMAHTCSPWDVLDERVALRSSSAYGSEPSRGPIKTDASGDVRKLAERQTRSHGVALEDSRAVHASARNGVELTDLSVFMLHPSGLYYVPATVKSDCVDQSLLIAPDKLDTNEKLQQLLSKCHPIAINVKFVPSPCPPCATGADVA